MTKSALRRAATILAAKGGLVADITVGDCLELEELQGGAGMRRTNRGAGLYGVLHSMGVFGADAPSTLRAFATQGQLSPRADARPLRHRMRSCPADAQRVPPRTRPLPRPHHAARPGPHPRAAVLARPGDPPSRDLLAEPRRRRRGRPGNNGSWSRSAAPRIRAGRSSRPRHLRSNGRAELGQVRAFYLDIAQWAMEEPARWGPWAAPCAGPPRGPGPDQGDPPAQVPDGPAHPRTPPRPVRAGSPRHRPGPSQRRTTRRRQGRRSRRAVHLPRRGAAPRPGPFRAHRPRSGARTPSRDPPRPVRGGGPGVLDLGRDRDASSHRDPDRGALRAQPPQPGPVHPADQQRADPAAADRPVQDRHRTAAGHQPRTGRRPGRGHPPHPRTLRRRAAGRRLRLPRTGLESAHAAAVPAPDRRRATGPIPSDTIRDWICPTIARRHAPAAH